MQGILRVYWILVHTKYIWAALLTSKHLPWKSLLLWAELLRNMLVLKINSLWLLHLSRKRWSYWAIRDLLTVLSYESESFMVNKPFCFSKTHSGKCVAGGAVYVHVCTITLTGEAGRIKLIKIKVPIASIWFFQFPSWFHSRRKSSSSPGPDKEHLDVWQS